MNAEAFLKIAFHKLPDNLAQLLESSCQTSADSFAQRCADAYNQTPGTLTDYDCPVCKNKGFVAYVGEDGECHEMRCGCIVKRNAVRRARASGMGKQLAKSFDNFTVQTPFQHELYKIASGFVDAVEHGDVCWLLTCGQSGCGKTHICSAACNKLLAQGYDVYYAPWVYEITELKRSRYQEGTQYTDRLNRLKHCQVLYIDDLFKLGKDEKGNKKAPSPADIELVMDILNFRLNSERITVISTEWTVQELLQTDEAVTGRIVEMCGEYVMQVAPDSHKNYRLRGLIQ